VNKPAISSDSQQTSLLGSMSHAWRALRHRNFKLFFFGQSISLIGTWMTRLATTWLVYRITHSALLLGIVTFAGQIVSFAVGPVAGVWVERLNRRKLLAWTQAAAAVQSLAMAALTLAHVINLWEIIVLATLQGLINAFDIPARQSFLVQMVINARVPSSQGGIITNRIFIPNRNPWPILK
jgi:MFS family permease